jgi:hypothetical protein
MTYAVEGIFAIIFIGGEKYTFSFPWTQPDCGRDVHQAME